MIYMLQAYRGLAAILVLFHHSTLLARDYFNIDSQIINSLYGGKGGVQFFFVLSGFIIYYIHKLDINQPSTLKVYFLKRFIRVYPIYFVVTLMIVPVFFMVPSFGSDYYRTLPSIVTSFLLIPYIEEPHIGVAWTLTHEIFFYLLFATLIINSKIGWAIIVSGLVLIFINASSYTTLEYPLTFLLSPNNALFFLGMLAAIILKNNLYRVNYNQVAIPLFIIGNIVLIFTVIAYSLAKYEPDILIDNTIIISLFGLGSFLIILQSGNTYLESVFEKRKFLLILGNASYAIYLIHYPVITFVSKIIRYFQIHEYLSGYLIYAILITAGITSGLVLHFFIERPLLAVAKKRLLS